MGSVNYEDASLFDTLPESVYIVDQINYELLYINRTGRRLLGLDYEESCEGKYCYDFLRGNGQPCDICTIGRGSKRYGREFYNEKIKRYFRMEDAPIRYRGREARVVMCVDITASIAQHHELASALQAEAVLNEAMQIFYVEPNLDEALVQMLEHIGLYLDAERCFMLSIEGGRMNATHEWCRRDKASICGQLKDLPFQALLRWHDVLARHKNMLVTDGRLISEKFPEEYDLLRRMEFFIGVGAPILINDEIVALIMIANLPTAAIDGASMMLLPLSYFIATSMVAEKNRKLLETASYSDTMTGVANRNAFIRDVDRIQGSLERSYVPVGVLYFDLNGLKPINDRHGHGAGDCLIKRLASSISLFFRKQEIYRTGGDEFVVLCLGMTESQFMMQLHGIMDHLATVNSLSVSVGCAWSGAPGKTIEQLVAEADANMYEEKQAYYKEKEISRNEKQDEP